MFLPGTSVAGSRRRASELLWWSAQLWPLNLMAWAWASGVIYRNSRMSAEATLFLPFVAAAGSGIVCVLLAALLDDRLQNDHTGRVRFILRSMGAMLLTLLALCPVIVLFVWMIALPGL